MSEEPERWEVGPAEAGLEVLELLADRYPDAPSSALRELVEERCVALNGRPCGPGQHLAAGDLLEVEAEGLARVEPAPLPGLAVLAEGPDWLAVDKPAGVAVESGRGETERPLRAGLLHHLRRTGQAALRPRLVHRLDKETSGVLLVAKTRAALVELSRQFEAREVNKTYLALTRGVPRQESGEVDAPLAPRGKRGPRAKGEPLREARTRWELAERFGRHALIRAFPETGRQHQVRQHLAQAGLPLLCDYLYGVAGPLLLSQLKPGYRAAKGERPLLDRLGLHAARLEFRAPGDGAPVAVEAPLPADLALALKQLRKYDPGR